MITFYLIDDHHPIIKALEIFYSVPYSDVINVGASTNVEDAIKKMPVLLFDVIVLDLLLQHDSPIENYNKISKTYPGIPIVIYTGETSTWWKLTMLSLGAYAFVSKIQPITDLTEAIVFAAAKQTMITEDIRSLLNPELNNHKHECITREEIEIAKLLSDGLAIKEIAAVHGKSVSSIEKILKTLRNKIQASSNAQLTRIMIHKGLIPG